TCQNGQCQPVAFVTGLQCPMGVAVVGADVYVANFGTACLDATHVDGSLIRVLPDRSYTVVEAPIASPAALWFDTTTSSFLMSDYFHYKILTRPLQASGNAATTL